ncbi:MAG TPA: mechanosensitive ion channel [Saprospiraceae bacterium]|nr:mechanosensitive ion channel [Saprospiraceae bacterium]HMU04039.1 mechanosensitive ion channel [Saprospiraceae bacterium]
MTTSEIQVVETTVLITIYIIVFFVTKTVINNTLKNVQLQRARRKIIIKAIHLFTTIAALILLAAIWGLKQNEIAVFASSVLTVIGIAFVAQWSLLSNITSSIILFFNHPLKIGDQIKILDREYPFEGEISDLTYFYVHLITTEGELITIPNSLLLQKAVSVIAKK